MANREQIAAEEGMGGLAGRWSIDAGPLSPGEPVSSS